jgi:hypothetical protein
LCPIPAFTITARCNYPQLQEKTKRLDFVQADLPADLMYHETRKPTDVVKLEEFSTQGHKAGAHVPHSPFLCVDLDRGM